LKFDGKDSNTINNELLKYGLFAFDHRIFYRLFTFSYKIFNEYHAPQILSDQLKTNASRALNYRLRNENDLIVAPLKNKFGELTFSYFFPKFINHFSRHILHQNFNTYKISVLNNINLHFDKFVTMFPRFDLRLKVIYVKPPPCRQLKRVIFGKDKISIFQSFLMSTLDVNPNLVDFKTFFIDFTSKIT
jgi:hypothetical protein